MLQRDMVIAYASGGQTQVTERRVQDVQLPCCPPGGSSRRGLARPIGTTNGLRNPGSGTGQTTVTQRRAERSRPNGHVAKAHVLQACPPSPPFLLHPPLSCDILAYLITFSPCILYKFMRLRDSLLGTPCWACSGGFISAPGFVICLTIPHACTRWRS